MGGFLATVLICDDEPALRELVRVSLDDGYEIVEADNGNSCLSAVREHRPDLVVLDLTRVLEKPFDPEQINAAVEEVLTEHRE